MKRWLVALALAAGLSAEAQPLTGGLLGRGASYSTFVPPAGCASGYVPYFNADLDLVCAPTVYAPSTDTTTFGTLAARNVTAIPLPASGAVTVTNQGTAGATTYTYSLQACLADGSCNAAGPASTTTTGNATLSATDFNRLSWSAVAGAASYKIRRDVGGATQGVIWSGTALTVDDTGLAGDSTAKPTVDGTGVVTAGRVLAGDGSAGAPSYSFGTQGTLGMYRAAVNTIGFGATGVASPVAVINGTNSFGFMGLNANGGVFFTSSSSATGTADLFLTRGGAANVRLGAADAASPVAQTLSMQNVIATTGDTSAVPFTLQMPRGTGAGNGGEFRARTAMPGAASTTQNAVTDRINVPSGWTTLTTAIASPVATITFPASSAISAEFLVTVRANDATDFQCLTSRVRVSSVRKATGNTVSTVSVVGTDLLAESAGGSTLTCTPTVTDGASAVTLNLNCASSLAETFLKATIQSISNGGGVAVSQL